MRTWCVLDLGRWYFKIIIRIDKSQLSASDAFEPNNDERLLLEVCFPNLDSTCKEKIY